MKYNEIVTVTKQIIDKIDELVERQAILSHRMLKSI